MEAGLSQNDVRDWALRRGFVEKDGMLTAMFQGVELQLTFSKLKLHVAFSKNDVRNHHMSPYLKHLKFDEHDMLHGAGLFSQFVVMGAESGDLPPWIPRPLADELQASRSKAEDAAFKI